MSSNVPDGPNFDAILRRAISITEEMRSGSSPLLWALGGELDPMRRSLGCPDTERLAAYAEDRLDISAAIRIATHENGCDICKEEVSSVRQFVQSRSDLTSTLQSWATPMIGRDVQKAAMAAEFGSGRQRLLTLAAPSGMGKTRLALESAAEQSDLFPDGVWYVGLSGVDDADHAAGEMLRTLPLSGTSTARPISRLRDFFADRRCLLVLDDIRPNSPVTSLIAEITGSAPDLSCLMTASSATGLRDEMLLSLPPLEVPENIRESDRVADSESVRLLMARMNRLAPIWQAGEEDVMAAAEICRRAGGAPLGIELAAARAEAVPLPQIAQELAEQNVGGRATSSSLQDLIRWTYSALPEHQQRFLSRASVFAGGFFTQQAREICEEDAVEEVLSELYRAALVRRNNTIGAPRYSLLDSVRDYSASQLGDEAPQAYRKHFTYFLNYAQRLDRETKGPSPESAMTAMNTDLNNIRAGMDRAEAARDDSSTGQYGLAMRHFLFLSGLWPEATERCVRAGNAFARDQNAREAKMLGISVANLRAHQGNTQTADEALKETLALAELNDDSAMRAEALYGLGYSANHRADFDAARFYFEAAKQQYDLNGDEQHAADALIHLGALAMRNKDLDAAESMLGISLPIKREQGNLYLLGTALSMMGNVVMRLGKLQEAETLFEECMDVRRKVGDVRGVAATLFNLAEVWERAGNVEAAEYGFRESARRFEEIHDWPYLAEATEHHARWALSINDRDTAVNRLYVSVRALNKAGKPDDAQRLQEEIAKLERDTTVGP